MAGKRKFKFEAENASFMALPLGKEKELVEAIDLAKPHCEFSKERRQAFIKTVNKSCYTIHKLGYRWHEEDKAREQREYGGDDE